MARVRKTGAAWHLAVPSLLGVLLIALSGCATVFGGANQRVTMEGLPDGTTVTIVDSRGEVVYDGEVPQSVQLKRFAESREAARYRARFENPDYAPRDVMIDPHYRSLATMLTWYPSILLVGAPFSVVGSLIDLAVGSSVRLMPNSIEGIEFAPVADERAEESGTSEPTEADGSPTDRPEVSGEEGQS